MMQKHDQRTGDRNETPKLEHALTGGVSEHGLLISEVIRMIFSLRVGGFGKGLTETWLEKQREKRKRQQSLGMN